MLANIIKWLYPDSRPLQDWIVSIDGSGPYITHWDAKAIGAPEPTLHELLAHEAEWRLDTAKQAKIAAIDARSHELITSGLEVAPEKKISTSTEAQINFLAFRDAVKSGHLSPPQGFSTLDGGEYIIDSEQRIEEIYAMWLARKKEILDGGRSLREAVLRAESLEEVEAVVDERT